MQLLVQDASELLMAVTLILAAIILTRYTRLRTADLPPEERGAGRPLYLSALGILTQAVASFLNYQLPLDAAASVLILLSAFSLSVIQAEEKILEIDEGASCITSSCMGQ